MKIFHGIIARTTQVFNEGDHCKSKSSAHESWWRDPMKIFTNFKRHGLVIWWERQDVLGNHLKDQLFHLVHMLSITLQLRRTSQGSINFGKKVLLGLFCSSDVLYAGWIWKGDVLIADLEELETMDVSEICSKSLSAKGWYFSKEGEFVFRINGRMKFPGGDQELTTSTLVWHC